MPKTKEKRSQDASKKNLDDKTSPLILTKEQIDSILESPFIKEKNRQAEEALRRVKNWPANW
ncbi:hypothetical protein [Dyadobacter luticola]|uniref:hypothetical protein n=1 Tax=Dyadobacter luticola TaxID=1979387 RepID=UPI0011060496|nr:hypothetical protein [Dyadobacter luticola]